MFTAEILRLFDLAKATATAAGEYLKRHQPESTVLEDQRRDVKLDADRFAEDLILSRLREGSAIPVLTEERGWVGSSNAEGMHWIVDPLDGTLNFLRGIPLCCVSVALWEGSDPLLGVIYNFNHQELFGGLAGGGAWLNESQVQVSDTRENHSSVLFTGFPVGGDFSTEAIEQFVGQVIGYKKIRSIGSAAMALAYVACGRGDIYYEHDVKIWDVAAGLALVRAAGGKISVQESGKLNSVTAWASNSYLRHGFE